MGERYKLRVSCKAALFTPDLSRVLIVETLPGRFGLPGGHMEENESPDDALRRELSEELGLTSVAVIRNDFWMAEGSRLILGYIGTIEDTTVFELQQEEIHEVHWTPVEAIIRENISIPTYRNFIVSAHSMMTSEVSADDSSPLRGLVRQIDRQ